MSEVSGGGGGGLHGGHIQPTDHIYMYIYICIHWGSYISDQPYLFQYYLNVLSPIVSLLFLFGFDNQHEI